MDCILKDQNGLLLIKYKDNLETFFKIDRLNFKITNFRNYTIFKSNNIKETLKYFNSINLRG